MRSRARRCCARRTSTSASGTRARGCWSPTRARAARSKRWRRRPTSSTSSEAELGEPDRATADTGADDPAFILYTSGTTKDPKGVVHAHRYTWAKRAQAERWLDARPDESCGAPPARAGRSRSGTCCSARGAAARRPSCTRAAFDPEERFRLIGELGADGALPGADRVPADGEGRRALALRPLARAAHGLGGRAAQPGGDPRVRGAFGRTIHDGYGQTENTLLVGNFPGAEIRPGSMGKPAPGYDVRVIDFDGNEAPRARRATSRCAATRPRCSPATGTRPRRRRPSTAASGT